MKSGTAGSVGFGVLAALLLALPAPGSEPAVVSSWIRTQAVPLPSCEPDSLGPALVGFGRMVRTARVVALGDCTRGTHESFRLKQGLIEYLVRDRGFTTLAIEAPLAETRNLNDYVTGGIGDAHTLVAGLNLWTWNTEEFLDLVEWMRRRNQSGRGRIELVGFTAQKTLAAELALGRFLAGADRDWVDSVALLTNVMRRARASNVSAVSSTGHFPVREAAGHRVRYSGWIRTEEVTGSAGLWWRADVGTAYVAFDNMERQHVDGTRDWARYSIELDIPANVDSIAFGVLMIGQGRAWFDSLAVEIDGRPWSDRGRFDLDLDEADGPRGFSRETGPAYRIAMDDAVSRAGRRSLQLASLPPEEVEEASALWADAEARARRLLGRFEGQRAAWSRSRGAEETAWAERCAHVLLQSVRSLATARIDVRDSCMASNLEWLIARSPKMIVWSHNDLIARRPGSVGGRLAGRLGGDLVTMGFVTDQGQYTAFRVTRETNDLVPGPPGSLEALAAAAGLPAFLLDLRPARGDTALMRAFTLDRTMRSLGTLASREQFSPASPATEFDLLSFVERTSASRLLGHP